MFYYKQYQNSKIFVLLRKKRKKAILLNDFSKAHLSTNQLSVDLKSFAKTFVEEISKVL